MPAVIVRTEFALALNQVATERGIDVDVVIDTIKSAILAAFFKDYAETTDYDEEKLTVSVDPSSGEAHVLYDGSDITPPGFGRIAAQTAKQVILQKIREAEKSAILSDYSSRVGSTISGMILRFDGHNIIVDIGRGQGVMPSSEQVRGEQYDINQRLTFYLKDIREGRRGSEIILSRADAQLVAGLFEREVPEVANKSVDVKAIAREPGSRTKIAVSSLQNGVDPVGSCVGQKGVRVQAVINELGQDEKIDVIQWDNDPIRFITVALAPAKDIVVTIDENKKQALVQVPEEYLSLAIGRGGQNVRLASRLTGYTIDIRDKNALEASNSDKTSDVDTDVFSNINVSSKVKESLLAAGYDSVKALTTASADDLAAIKGVGPKTVEQIKQAISVIS